MHLDFQLKNDVNQIYPRLICTTDFFFNSKIIASEIRSINLWHMWNFIQDSHRYFRTSFHNDLDILIFPSWNFLLWSKIFLCQMIRPIYKYDDEKNICFSKFIADKQIIKINSEIFVRITMIQNIVWYRFDHRDVFIRCVLNAVTSIFRKPWKPCWKISSVIRSVWSLLISRHREDVRCPRRWRHDHMITVCPETILWSAY